MDNLTHALLGAGLAGLIKTPQSERRGIWLAVMLGSEAPDLDLLPSLLNQQAQLELHRGFSHSLGGLALTAGLLTLVTGILEPRLPRRKALTWISLALIVHIVFDALNSYGTRVLLPFNTQPLAFDALYSIDFVLIGVLGAGILLYRYGYKRALATAMLAAMVYTTGRIALHQSLYKYAGRHLMAAHYSVLPTLNPFGAWLVIGQEKDRYLLWKIDPISRKTSFVKEIPANMQQAIVVRARQIPLVQSFLQVARYPCARVHFTGSGYYVGFTDLRLWPLQNFNANVLMDKDLGLIKVKISPKSLIK